MRNLKQFLVDVVKKPPIIFPMLALGHLIWLAYLLWSRHTVPLNSIDWLQPLWMLAFTVCWIGCCDLRKWAGFGYIGLMALNLALDFYSKHDKTLNSAITDPLFPMDILFALIVLLYFRKFE